MPHTPIDTLLSGTLATLAGLPSAGAMRRIRPLLRVRRCASAPRSRIGCARASRVAGVTRVTVSVSVWPGSDAARSVAILVHEAAHAAGDWTHREPFARRMIALIREGWGWDLSSVPARGREARWRAIEDAFTGLLRRGRPSMTERFTPEALGFAPGSPVRLAANPAPPHAPRTSRLLAVHLTARQRTALGVEPGALVAFGGAVFRVAKAAADLVAAMDRENFGIVILGGRLPVKVAPRVIVPCGAASTRGVASKDPPCSPPSDSPSLRTSSG